jgi:hypothetical protein
MFKNFLHQGTVHEPKLEFFLTKHIFVIFLLFEKSKTYYDQNFKNNQIKLLEQITESNSCEMN